MIRKLILSLFFVFSVACSNVEASIQPLNELNVNNSGEIFESPHETLPEFNIEDESLDSLCVCSWGVWHENGRTCAGIRCSKSCSSIIRSCNERKACIIEGI